MQGILVKMFEKRDSEPFRNPVNWKELGLTDYLDIVKHPRDLAAIRKKLQKNEYRNKEECIQDVRLVFSNAMMYNAVSKFCVDNVLCFFVSSAGEQDIFCRF